MRREDRYYCTSKSGCRIRSLFSILKRPYRNAKNYGSPMQVKNRADGPYKSKIDLNRSDLTDSEIIINDPEAYKSSIWNDNEVTIEKVLKASNERFKRISSNEFQNLMMTYSQITRERRIRWHKFSKARIYKESLRKKQKETPVGENDYYSTYKNKMSYDKDPLIIDSEYKKNNRLLFSTDSSDSNELYEQIKKETEELENKLEEFSHLLHMAYTRLRNNRQLRIWDEDQDIDERMTFEEQFRLRHEKMYKEYERQIELESEITHSIIKKEMQMAQDAEAKKPHDFITKLNRNFKKSFIEDFFREPVAACVEVLEYFAAWIAEKLSLPPPEPVNHDVVIYKREVDTNNYSYLTSVIKNKKIQYLYSRGMSYNDSESLGYKFLHN